MHGDALPGEEAVRVRLLLNEVAVGELEDAVVEVVGGGLAAWDEDVAPLLLEEGVLLDLLAALAALLLGFAHAEKGSAKTAVTVLPIVMFIEHNLVLVLRRFW